ncbi:MAG: hypothetical protein VKL59_17730 [Nostocaceae cyanobacterium]|nr:hypothetical protein [Nostocaceae cyanobacterium]
MSDITLGDLLTLIVQEMSQTFEQTTTTSEAVKLHVSDVDLEIPAYVTLQPKVQPESETPPRLIVGLPSTRENPSVGRLGRLRISIEAQQT